MPQDNIKNLYKELSSTYELGSEDDFRKYLSDGKNREALRKELESEYEVGDSTSFSKYLGFTEDAPVSPVEKPDEEYRVASMDFEGQNASSARALDRALKSSKEPKVSQSKDNVSKSASVADAPKEEVAKESNPVVSEEVPQEAVRQEADSQNELLGLVKSDARALQKSLQKMQAEKRRKEDLVYGDQRIPLRPEEKEDWNKYLLSKEDRFAKEAIADGTGINELWARVNSRAYSLREPFFENLSYANYARSVEGERKLNRAAYDDKNFNGFYDRLVAPVFESERSKANKIADEKVKNMPVYSYADAVYVAATGEKYTDPERVINSTMSRVQKDDSFSDYVLSRMGLNSSGSNDNGSEPQLSPEEERWLQHLLTIESGEVADKILGRLYDTYKEEDAPRSALDYIAGKAIHENFASMLNEAVIRRVANSSGLRQQLRAMASEEFGKNQSWGVRAAGGAAPFAVDMLTGGFALPSMAGSMTFKGGMSLLAKQVTKEMEKRALARGLEGAALKAAVNGGAGVAERYLATQAPVLNVALRAASSAANFATYDMQSEAVRQIGEGGFSLSKLLGAGVHGAALGAVMGAAGGTIAEATKNSGLLGKVGGAAAGLGAETAIFGASDGLRRAYEEGIDIEDVDWGDTMGEAFGMVVGMKAVGGMLNPREVAQRFRKSQDYDLKLNNRDITDLKNAGLNLEDVFKGFGEFGKVAPLEPQTIKRSDSELHTDESGHRRTIKTETEETVIDQEAYDRLLQNPDISSSTKRKIVYLATGKVLAPERVYGASISTGDDGNSVTTTNEKGEVIETKDFVSAEAAQEYYDNMKSAGRMNTIAAFEELADRQMMPDVLESAKARTLRETGVDVDNVITEGLETKEETDAILDSYIKNLQEVYMERFNENLLRLGGRVDGKPRTETVRVDNNNVEEVDARGNVIDTHEYETPDDAEIGRQEATERRDNTDMLNDYTLLTNMPKEQLSDEEIDELESQVIEGLPGYQQVKGTDEEDAFIEANWQFISDRINELKTNSGDLLVSGFAREKGLTYQDVREIMDKDPVSRTDAEADMMRELAERLHNRAFEKGTLHIEQSRQDGVKAADATSGPDAVPEAVSILTQELAEAKEAYDAFMGSHDDIREAIEGMDGVDAISYVINNFSGAEREEAYGVIADYMNAQSKMNGYIQRQAGKVEEFVQDEVSKRTLKGEVYGIGVLDPVNTPIYTLHDGDESLHLVNGNVVLKPEGRIDVDQSSEMVICMDEEGNLIPMKISGTMTVDAGEMDDFANSLRQKYSDQNVATMEAAAEAAGLATETGDNDTEGNNTGNTPAGDASGAKAVDTETTVEPQPAEESTAIIDEPEQPLTEEQQEEVEEQVYEDYLATHPLTEEQIMADTEADEDEKQAALDYLNGDDNAISQLYYDEIFNRAPKPAEEPQAEPVRSNEEQAEIDAADQEVIDMLNSLTDEEKELLRMRSVTTRFNAKGLNLLSLNANQRKVMLKLLKVMSKAGYLRAKGGVDYDDWFTEMSNKFGGLLKGSLGWSDENVGGLLGELWKQKYSVDGERKTLEEYSSAAIALKSVPDVLFDTPDDARKRGYKMVDGVRVDRQKEKPMPSGKEVEVQYSTKDNVKGRMAVSELDDIQASHTPNGQKNHQHFIPEAQPKNEFGSDRQQKAQTNASPGKFRPELTLTFNDTQSAYQSSAPQTNRRREVIQGNGRRNLMAEVYAPGNEVSAGKYRRYLKEHAEELGVTPEQIDQMNKPVAHIVLDVDDNEAIRLGQFKASDLESGGSEVPQVSTVTTKLGDRYGSFANNIMTHEDPDASISERVEKNADSVVRWLNQMGAISDTEAKTLLENKDLARQFMKEMLTEKLFSGVSDELKSMFYELPQKVQNVIVGTIGREAGTSNENSIIDDVRQSIQAYHEISASSDRFRTVKGKDTEERLRSAEAAINDWLRQINIDGSQNSGKYNNFALELAKRYKAYTDQKTLQGQMNDYYDLVNGAPTQGNLFEEPVKREKLTKEDAIKRVFNINYEQKEKNNGRQDVLAVGSDLPESPTGGQGEPGEHPSGERETEGAGAPVSGGGAESSGEGEVGGATESHHTEQTNPLKAAQDVFDAIDNNKLEGDSVAFKERQRKLASLRDEIREKLDYHFKWADKKVTFGEYKKLAKDAGIDISDTDLQEMIEAEIVDYARAIASDEHKSDERKFKDIVRLYETQPSLNVRDNDRINKQQYSTPAPMAYLMGQFVLPSEKRGAQGLRGLEPSAGNGMLTLALPKEVMHVNDIDEMRLSNLAKQGFAMVTSQDGTLPFGEKEYDLIVTNPPFGNTTPKEIGGYTISGLEQVMAINALDAMKDDGRAAIIIGGNTEYAPNGTIKGKDKAFLNYLYSHYNVVDVINCDGKSLYSRQGTGFPVRMILIDGRKQETGGFAPVESKARAEQVKSYNELYKRINDDILSDRNKPAGVHDTESGESGGVDDTSNAGDASQTGVRGVRGGGSSQQSGAGTQQRPSVSGSPSTTDGGTQRTGDTVVGQPVLDGGSRTETSKPSGKPVTQTDVHREGDAGRRDDTERPSSTTGNSVGVGQRGAGAAQYGNGSSVEPSGEAAGTTVKQEVKRGLGTEKVPYRKQSDNPFTLQSLMPAEQADVVKKALEELGDVDQFLVNELGYSNKEELHQALAAEQIDSVAMAIHQMNQGNAFIIGDQTGIGKGRQAAALIRYGVKHGGFPVFITVKKGLFSDMYRDLCDIGSPGLRPFIWSADDTQHSANVTDKDGNVIYERPSDKEQKRVIDYINNNGKLPPEYDYVLTTYDAFKSGTMDYENGQKKARNFGKKKPGPVHYNGQAKRDALETLAQNSYVIMDESHNAGGEGSNVSGYLQYITTKAKGLTFLSATFAKRPGNMPIYSLKTAISKAGVGIDELIDAVKRGGATFQEIMSKALTEAGQMIRRERDMSGVTIDWRGIEDDEVVEKQRKQYDIIIGLFNQIIDFQRTYVDPVVNSLNDEAANVQGIVDHTPGTRDMGINNTPFASRTYNMVQQVLLSLKAEEAAKRAIEHLKMGHKPVITVANTNERAADEVSMASQQNEEGMEMPDLGVNLKKGLQGTLRVTRKDALGNSTNTMIPFERLSEEGQARYSEIMDAIENASSGLSLSPIDVIKNELKKAGYKVGELTGRTAEFVYNEDGTVKRVKRQDTDKKKVAADFNNGKLDALILNRSAGTGISLHASSKFGDQRQRVMIVAQAQGDVNDEVQIRGRIDRTGQVLRGMYEYIVSQIPSEQRLLMMLKAKLRSLDANTTSSQKSKFNEMQVQDIINKYGDAIVIQYLAEHPDTYAKMADPLGWGESVFDTPVETLVSSASKPTNGGDGATASKVLGRMALLTVKEQEQMLDEIGQLYQAEIDRLNEMGENDLEITEMPLRAKTLKKDVWEQGVEPGGKNPFADNTYVEKVEMDVLKKPMKASEVKGSQNRGLAGKTWGEFKDAVIDEVDKWADAKKNELTEVITKRAEKKGEAERAKYIRGAKKNQDKNGMSDADIEKNGQYQYEHFYDEEIGKLQAAIDGVDKQRQAFVDVFETFTTDGVYAIPSDIYDLSGMTFEPSFGKLIDVKIASNFSTAASTISFATLDGRRKITIPISGMVKQKTNEKRNIFPVINSLTAQARSGMFGSNVTNTLKALEQNIDNWDRLTSTATRKKGYIITGNLLKALVSSREQGLGGKLISYTTDTGDVRQGLLMPDNFEPNGLTSKTPISSAKDDLNDWNKKYKIESADKEVTVRRDDYDWGKKEYIYSLQVPKSKRKGEKYFNDETLLSLMDGQFEGSGKLKAYFKAQNLDAVLKRLDEIGVTVEENANKVTRFRRSDANHIRASRRRFVERAEKEAKKWEKKSGVPVRVLHSIDEIDNDEVRAAIASGAEVYGWYEELGGKRHVCIFLPSCDSDQDVKMTFVHEIVGHEGFRGLFGHDKDAYNEFMRALVMDLKSEKLSEYIKENLKDNGFDIYRTVDEYLAEAAEKGWEDLTFWDKVRYWLIEALRKIGLDFTPSITDTKYLTWLSHHGLDKSDAWKEARRNALLRKLRRERNAAKMENGDFVDWSDRKRRDATEDAQRTVEEEVTSRFRKVDDPDLLKKLNEGPTVKRLRAMQLINGKLYPPMSAKVGNEMREPTEIGVWEQSEERPDLIDKNGKFKLDKAQKGQTAVPAAYNPYFHTSTSGLNDQFTSAYKRPELVVVEVEIPESELTSGYKAEGAKDHVGNTDWHSGVVNGALPKDRQRTVTLSRWSKVVRIVPDSEMADMVAKQLEGTGVEVPYNVVTPNQRKELESRGVKISATPAGTVTEDINGNPIPKKGKTITRFRTASAKTARDSYEHALRRLSYVWKEAHVDDMQAACELAKAISGVKHVEDIPAHENFIWNANQQSSKEEQLDFMITKKYMKPLDDVIAKILPDMGRNLEDSVRNLQMYMIQKHGLERNRALFVRDWLRAERRAVDPLDQSAIDRLNDIEDDYIMLLDSLRQDLRDGNITYRDYLDEIDNFIRGNIDNNYSAEENDYSGLTELMPTKKGYDDAAVCDEVMNTESMLGDRATELWDRTRDLSQYSLDMEYNSGLMSKDTHDRVSNMFAFYVPLRGFDEEVAEDRFDYLQENGSTGYIGSVLKNARGRKSLSDVDVIAALGAMASAANRRGLTNQTKQTFARFVRNHYDKDGDRRLVTEAGYGWAEKEGIDAYGNIMWKEVFPDIPEGATGDDVQNILEQFEADMKAKMQAGDAKRIRQKDTIGMKFLDKEHKSQHVVEVYFNGEKHLFVVNGSPRAAQAINGDLRTRRGSNILWLSSLSHFMAKMNTSYSPDFIVRNTERDAIFAFTSLGIKENPKYLAVWTKNYGRMVGRMLYGTPIDGVNLFDRYRKGKLNLGNKTDMYFKEFMENGGETGWVELKNRDKWKKFIERSIRDKKRNKAAKIGEEVFTLIPDLIEGMNERAENMARFATYMTSRQMGRSIKRSISDAKEVSVNFNRKGSGKNAASMGRQTNGWFRKINATFAGYSAQNLQDYVMFYNAGMQAMNNFAKTVGRHPVKGSLALSAFILGGFIAPMLNGYLRELFGDDGKDPYAEIPEWRRRNGLCLYTGNNSFAVVELPIELRAMYGIGDMAASYITRPELRSEKGIALDIASQLSQISPLDFLGEKSGSPLWTLVPSGARPIAEAAFNVNWQGRPIEREETRWNQNSPRWERAFRGVNDLYVNASKRLNAMTNNYSEEQLKAMGVADSDVKDVDASIKGWADGKITDPALVQHVVEGYFGGAGKTANNFAFMYKMFKQGEEWMDIVKSDKTPILRTFHYTPTEQTSYARTKSRWWYYNNEAQKTIEEVKRLRNYGVKNPYDKLKSLSSEDSIKSLQAKEMERAKKKYDKLNRRLKKEEDPDEAQRTQMEIDALMYDTVELLDSIGGLRRK